MYKFAYSLTKIDLRNFKRPVIQSDGVAIAKNPASLLSHLYEDGMEIVAFEATPLYKVFGAPNDETVVR